VSSKHKVCQGDYELVLPPLPLTCTWSSLRGQPDAAFEGRNGTLNHIPFGVHSRGAGTFSEEGGQEWDWRGSADFFYFAPSTFEFAHPEFSVLGGQMGIDAHPNY